MLSSLFWGYTVAPIPASFIGQHFAAKLPLLITVLIGSLITVLTPFIATIMGWKFLCAARFVCGVMQGSSYPLMQIILSKWLHPDERGFLTSLTYAGSKCGMCLMLALGGIIAGSIAGWPGIFYISGGMGFLWCGFWWFYITDTPAQCRTISKQERNYLDGIAGVSVRRYPAPWSQMLTSIPFWSVLFAQTTSNWGFYLLLNEIPTYLNGVFNFNINAVI